MQIGLAPNSGFIRDLVEVNQRGDRGGQPWAHPASRDLRRGDVADSPSSRSSSPWAMAPRPPWLHSRTRCAREAPIYRQAYLAGQRDAASNRIRHEAVALAPGICAPPDQADAAAGAAAHRTQRDAAILLSGGHGGEQGDAAAAGDDLTQGLQAGRIARKSAPVRPRRGLLPADLQGLLAQAVALIQQEQPVQAASSSGSMSDPAASRWPLGTGGEERLSVQAEHGVAPSMPGRMASSATSSLPASRSVRTALAASRPAVPGRGRRRSAGTMKGSA